MLQQSTCTESLSKVLQSANDVINNQEVRRYEYTNSASGNVTKLQSGIHTLSGNSAMINESDIVTDGNDGLIDSAGSISILDLDGTNGGSVQCQENGSECLNNDENGFNSIVHTSSPDNEKICRESGKDLPSHDQLLENKKAGNSDQLDQQTSSNPIITGKERKETEERNQKEIVSRDKPRKIKFKSDFSPEVLEYHEFHNAKKIEDYEDVDEAFRAWSSDEEHSTDKTLRTDEDPVHCLLCKYKTARPAELNLHIRTIHVAGKHHPQLHENRIQCPDCDRTFNNSAGLKQHQFKFHPPLLTCADCPYNSLCRFHMIIHRIIYHPESREGQQFYSQAWNQGPYKELYKRFRESESLVSKGSQPLPDDPFSNKCVDLAEEAVNKNLKIKDVCVKDVVLATDSIISSLISETIHKFQTRKENIKHSEQISVLQMTELEKKKSFQLKKVLKVLDKPSLKTSLEMKTRKISSKPDIMIQFREMIRDKVCLLCETDQKKRKIPHRQFVDHLFGHFELGTHYCQRCDRTFKSASAMSHHITYMHELRLRQKAMTQAAGTAADNERYQSLMSRLKTKMISQSTTLTELKTLATERASMKEKKICIKNAHKKRSAKKQPASSASTRGLEVGSHQNRTQYTRFNLVRVIPITCVPVIPIHHSYLHQSDLAENTGSFVNTPVQSDTAEHHSDDFSLSAEEQRYFYLCNQDTSLLSLSTNGDLNFSFEELRFIFMQRQKVLLTEQNTLQSSETSHDSYLINRDVRMEGTSLIKKRKKPRSRKGNLSSSQMSSARNALSKKSSEKMTLPPGRICKPYSVTRPTTNYTSMSSVSERMEILGLKKVVSAEERTHENSDIVRDKSSDVHLVDQDDRISKTSYVQKRSKPCTRKDNPDSSRNIVSIELLDDGEMNLENMHVNHYESRPNTDNELTCLDNERTENKDQPHVQSALMEFDDYFSAEELRFSFYIYAMHSRKKSKFVKESARKGEEGKPRRIKKHSGVGSPDDSDVSDDLNDPYYRIDKEDLPYEPNIELPIEKRSYPKRKRVTRKHFTLLDHDPPDTTIETTDKSGSESDEEEEAEEEVSQQIHDELSEEEDFINGIFLEAGYGIDLSFPVDDEIFNDSGQSDHSNDDGQSEEDEEEDVIMVNDFEGNQFLVKDCKGEVKVEDCKVCLKSSVDKENSNLESNRSQQNQTGHDVQNDVNDSTMADRKPTARKSAPPRKVKNIVLNKERKRKRSRRLKYTSRKKKASSHKTSDGTNHSMSPNLTVNTRPIDSEVNSVVNPQPSPKPPTIKHFPSVDSPSTEHSQSTSRTSQSSTCCDTSSSESKLFQPSFIKPPSSPGPPHNRPSPAPTSLPDVKPELYTTQLKSPGPPIVKQLKLALSSPRSPEENTQTGPFSPGAPYVRPINSPGPPTVRQVEIAATGTNSNSAGMPSIRTTAVQRTSKLAGPPLVVYQKVTDHTSQLNPQLPRVTPLRPVLCIPMSDPAAAALQMYQRQINVEKRSRPDVETNHVTGSSLGIVDSSVRDVNTSKLKTPVRAVPCSVNRGNFQVCGYCNKRFKSFLCAKIHFWVDHQQLSYNRDLLLPMTRASQEEVNNGICPYCRFNIVGDDESLFEKHILTHLQLLPYVCATCSFPAVSLRVLEKHACFAGRVLPLKQEVVEPVLSEQRFEVKVEEKPTVTLCQELIVKKEMG